MEILFVDNSVEMKRKIEYNVEAYEIGSFVCYSFYISIIPFFYCYIFLNRSIFAIVCYFFYLLKLVGFSFFLFVLKKNK